MDFKVCCVFIVLQLTIFQEIGVTTSSQISNIQLLKSPDRSNYNVLLSNKSETNFTQTPRKKLFSLIWCRLSHPDQPKLCLEQIRKEMDSELPGNNSTRGKRCFGNIDSSFPLFGIGPGRNISDVAGATVIQELGSRSDVFKSLTDMSGPFFEQISALFSGNEETARNSIPGQVVTNLPRALSSFTDLLDTFNVAAAQPEQSVGSGREANATDPPEEMVSRPTVSQLRAVFLGDPTTGSVENTLPVQIYKSLPIAMDTAFSLLSSFTDFSDPGNDGTYNFDTENGRQDLSDPNAVSQFRSENEEKLPRLPESINSELSSIVTSPIEEVENKTKENPSVHEILSTYLRESNSQNVIKPKDTIIIIS